MEKTTQYSPDHLGKHFTQPTIIKKAQKIGGGKKSKSTQKMTLDEF